MSWYVSVYSCIHKFASELRIAFLALVNPSFSRLVRISVRYFPEEPRNRYISRHVILETFVEDLGRPVYLDDTRVPDERKKRHEGT